MQQQVELLEPWLKEVEQGGFCIWTGFAAKIWQSYSTGYQIFVQP